MTEWTKGKQKLAMFLTSLPIEVDRELLTLCRYGDGILRFVERIPFFVMHLAYLSKVNKLDRIHFSAHKNWQKANNCINLDAKNFRLYFQSGSVQCKKATPGVFQPQPIGNQGWLKRNNKWIISNCSKQIWFEQWISQFPGPIWCAWYNLS